MLSINISRWLSPRFFKKASGILQWPPSVRLSVCPSVRPSVTLSPPKPLDEIQPNLVCELLTWRGCTTAHFLLVPPPGALGRGQFSKFNQIWCLSYLHEWHMHWHNFWIPAPWGLGERPKGQISLNLKTLFRNSTRFGVWVTYMNDTCTGTIFWVPASRGLVEGPKGQILLNLNYKVNFKGF